MQIVKKIRIIISLAVLLITVAGDSSATSIHGKVTDEKGELLAGAAVQIPVSGEVTVSDINGHFYIEGPDSFPFALVTSFTGFAADTLVLHSAPQKELRIKLVSSIELNAVNIVAKQQSLDVSTIKTINSEKITGKELLRAACCNLSEAFETSPSVTVAYRDAVTGAQEIQLLGLSGTYSQLMTENIPNMRGIAAPYGLKYIPGPFMESIQVTKGSGSVLNGFESTTGQINIEFKKPHDPDVPRFYLNLFSDVEANPEINTFYKRKLSDKWSSILMVHGKYMNHETDRNDDGFMDEPMNKQLNIYNRWQFDSHKRVEAQVGVRFIADEIEGGQIHEIVTHGHSMKYETSVSTRRAELFGKLGIVFPEKPGQSIGNIVQLTYHDMQSSFGLREYNALEKNFYIQSMYEDTWKGGMHKLTAGLTLRHDKLNEEFPGLPESTYGTVSGIMAEYTFNLNDKLSIVSGVREDLHNGEEFVFTPRVHAKYNFSENLIVRMSGGHSYRVPYLIADNLQVLASSRQIIFADDILPERAWNYGANLTNRFKWHGREGTFSVDAYRTHFTDQMIVDAYSDSASIRIYNLDGESYSNSFQVSAGYDFAEHLNVRLAYKIDDVKSTYGGVLREKPLVAKSRALATIGWTNQNEHWKADYTVIYEGSKKLPTTFTDTEFGPVAERSPEFIVMNLQVTKVFRKFELYAGSENLLDFRQDNPIINAENPFSNAFDAASVWGPVKGRRIYAGLRYSIR